MKLLWLVAATVSLVACGPSPAHVRRARTAHYTCDYDQVYRALAGQVKLHFDGAHTAADTRQVVTAEQWYLTDGTRYRPSGATASAANQVPTTPEHHGDEPIYQVSYTFDVTEQGTTWRIESTPSVLSRRAGKEAVSLPPNSDYVPAWVHERGHLVLVAVYNRLWSCSAAGEFD